MTRTVWDSRHLNASAWSPRLPSCFRSTCVPLAQGPSSGKSSQEHQDTNPGGRGRNACFGLLAEIKKATTANNYLCRGLPIKLRVEDSPVARERKSFLLRACRALELKLPQATRPRIDWPDKIYGMLDGEPGPLLAKLGSSNTIVWQESALLQIAPGLSKAELDECMESL